MKRGGEAERKDEECGREKKVVVKVGVKWGLNKFT